MSDQGQRPPDNEDEQLWAAWSEAEKVAENKEGGKDAPTEAAEPAPVAGAAAEEPDLWANAPPDLKAAHDQQVKALESATTEHARRSIEGRIVAYTRRLKERNEAAAQPPAPAQEEEGAADPFAEMAADYPEIAKPLEAKLAPIAEKISKFDAIEKSRLEAADRQMDADLAANEQLLATQHPDWNTFLHEYGAAFGKWIVDQPLHLRQAFVTNQDAIIDPYSAIETVTAFKSFVEQNTQPSGQGGNQPPASTEQNRLNSRRAAQLAGSASPQSVGSRPTPSGIPQDGDEQAIWNSFRDIDPEERKYRNA
jgi:hypothetical protein